VSGVSRYFSKARHSGRGGKAGVADGDEVVVLARFDEREADLLSVLLRQHLELLDVDDPLGPDPDPLAKALGIADWGGGPVEPPRDPALARLFPDGYRDDPEMAGEFRRLTEPDLREGKRAHARVVLGTLGALAAGGSGEPLRLDFEEARAWLGAMNDVRLVLSVRLGVADDNDHVLSRVAVDDPQFAIAVVYDWLGGLLESLVGALGG
jgi:hypothetical protein